MRDKIGGWPYDIKKVGGMIHVTSPPTIFTLIIPENHDSGKLVK